MNISTNNLSQCNGMKNCAIIGIQQMVCRRAALFCQCPMVAVPVMKTASAFHRNPCHDGGGCYESSAEMSSKSGRSSGSYSKQPRIMSDMSGGVAGGTGWTNPPAATWVATLIAAMPGNGSFLEKTSQTVTPKDHASVFVLNLLFRIASGAMCFKGPHSDLVLFSAPLESWRA